ncbi:MAG: T9SS type A sorting domain-containing protein [Bacteroidota bacterium]
MKKHLFIIALLAGMAASAQTLEKKYPNVSLSVAKYGPGETGYVSFDKATKKISFYSESHTLIKTTTLNVLPVTGVNLLHTSKKTINNDDKIEVIITTNDPAKVYIFNEDGLQLFTQNNVYHAYPYATSEGNKLMLYLNDQAGFEVYKLSGIFLGKKEVTEDGQDALVYPVPGKDFVTIEFPVLHKNASLTVYDIKGKEMSTQTVNGNLLTIETKTFAPGNYTYTLKTTDGQISTGKFIITQ